MMIREPPYSTYAEVLSLRSLLSVDVHTGQVHPIIGIPDDVPVPRNVILPSISSAKLSISLIFAVMISRLFLIPSPLGDNNPLEVIPQPVLELLGTISHFAVEEVRTARRYLSASGLKGRMDSLNFYEINEHSTPEEIEAVYSVLASGHDMALISEAGLPAVADPGSQLVALAHAGGVEVIPFVGPSSLMLALMASGMNGQRFTFYGYVPVRQEQRRNVLRDIERRSARDGETGIMIETPYRNDSLMADILGVCRPSTRVCVAADITLPTQYIRTQTVAQWKKSPTVIGKRPCVFLIYAG